MAKQSVARANRWSFMLPPMPDLWTRLGPGTIPHFNFIPTLTSGGAGRGHPERRAHEVARSVTSAPGGFLKAREKFREPAQVLLDGAANRFIDDAAIGVEDLGGVRHLDAGPEPGQRAERAQHRQPRGLREPSATGPGR